MENTLSKYLFSVLCLLLTLPCVLQIVGLSGNYLGGHIERTQLPIWSLDSWLSNEFQPNAEKYLSEKYGLRTEMIRLNNQYRFSFFSKTNVKDVIIGKEGYLFAEGYIQAYIGSGHFDEEGVRMKVKRLVDINRKLMVMGKKIVVVRAAGKASFFPEYIPAHYFPKKEKNIIDANKEALSKSGLFYIDFNDWFLELKDTSRYPLFPKTGIHWSEYGMTLAADSLIKYLEKIEGVNLPDMRITDVQVSSKPLKNDNDIERSMNLMLPVSNIQYAYPKVKFDTLNKDSLRVLVVGDSYYQQMFDLGLSKLVFDKGQFLFYGRLVYPDKKDLDEIGLMNLISDYDVILLMCTEANLQHFPWGVHSALYESLCKDEIGNFIQKHLDEIIEIENKIRADKAWYDLIVKQAESQKTSIAEELRRDALYKVEANHLDD